MGVQEVYQPTKIVMAILNRSKLERITSDAKINEAFFRLSQEFPESFGEFIFTDNLGRPDSNLLNDILNILKLTGMLNPTGFGGYKLIKFDEGIRKSKEDYSEEKIRDIEEMAKRFDGYMQKR